ncbi:MAG: hypothetical protein J5733_05655, partial [Bacteroidaceae bacterium]|nr:hypothetical protein [Bacteroidaceae bacterium]
SNMKTEDIDKKIGMPDVDKEWARFEQEVILGGTKRRSALAWALGVGIAASVALLLIFNLGKEQTEQAPLIAQAEEIKPQTPQPARKEVQQVKEQEVETKTSTPVIAQDNRLALANVNAPATSSLEFAAHEYTGAVQKMEDLEGLAFESVDQALQEQIAGRDISHNEAEPELKGEIAGQEAIDPNYNDSILVMLDGIRLPDSLCTRHFIRHGGIHSYLEKKGLKVDKIVHLSDESISMNENEKAKQRYMHYIENEKAKQRYLQYIEKYGRLAELGVAEITTCNDSLNEVFILQHPELMKTHRRVEGYVFDDETNKAIEYAMINYIHKGKYKGFVASDSLGHFVLWVPQFADTLKAKHVGYQDAIFLPADTTVVIRLKDKIIKDLKREIKF